MDIERIIRNFRRTVDGKRGATAHDAFNACDEVSLAFQAYASERGMDVDVKRFEFTFTADKNHPAVKRNMAVAEAEYWVGHWINVLPDGSLLDWTARQFDPQAKHPTRYAEPPVHWSPRTVHVPGTSL